jgi:hypothetical protein
MDRELIKYAPIYRAWYRLAHAKDTAEKRLAFLDGILDYAFTGAEAADPAEMENPHGVDYARFDGYLTAKDTLDLVLMRSYGGSLGGQNGRGENKARIGNQNARKHCDSGELSETENEISEKRKLPCVSNASHLANQTQAPNASLNKVNINKSKIKEREKRESLALANENGDFISGEPPETEIPVNSDEAIPQGEDGQPDLRRVLPTRDEMVCYARQIGVPASYLPTFVGEMRSLGWGYVNRSGAFVALNRRNFKAILRSFFNQHERNKANGNDGTGSRQARSTAYDEGLAAAAGV